MWTYLKSPEDRLAFLLTLSFLNENDLSSLDALFSELSEQSFPAGQKQGHDQSWDRLNKLIQAHEIQPLAYYRALELNQKALGSPKLHFPAALLNQWKMEAKKIEDVQISRFKSAQVVLDFFRENSIPWVVLKGQSLAEEVYQLSAYKKMNDIDILVQPDDLQKIYDFLKLKKHISVMQLSENNPRAQEKYSHHWPPLLSSDFHCVWGVYWSLVSPLKKYHLDMEGVWSRIKPVNFAGQKAHRLHSEYILHHLCLHLNLYKSGLKEVQDIYNLVRHFDRPQNRSQDPQHDQSQNEFNWSRFEKKVRETGSFDEVYHALRTTYAYSGISSLDSVANSLEPEVSVRMKKFVKQKCSSPERLLRSRSTYISRIEKTYGFFTITKSPLEKAYFLLQMWKLLLFPPQNELIKMSYSKPSSSFFENLKLRLLGPSLVSRQLIHDLGWKLHIILILSHHLVLIRCFWNHLRQRPQGPQKLKEILRSLGVSDPNQIPEF